MQKAPKAPPSCYIVCGFLGAGKTTYSKQLAEDIGAVHLNVDEWCVKLFKPKAYEKDYNTCFHKTVDYLWKKAKKYAKQQKSVIFDMGFWTKDSRKDAIKRAKKIGCKPVVLYVFAPDNISKKRIAQRTGVLAEYNKTHYDEIKKHFEEPSAPEEYLRINNY